MIHIFPKILIPVLLSFLFVPFAGAGERMPVFVSILPQKYFVQQIGKDLVDVSVLVEPGSSPHTYEPKPRQMTALAGTNLYFAIGVEFEKVWLDRISAVNPQMKIVHTDIGIKKIPMAAHHQAHEAHKPHGHHHDPGGLDPHIWLSPPLVKQQARSILMALQNADPTNRDAYETHYKQFLDELYGIDAQLRAMFADKKGFRFMVFHPAWGYFAQAYHLHQIPVEVSGRDPKPKELVELIKKARAADVNVIFVQPQFSTRNAETVAREINGRVVFADPLEKDWLANMKAVSELFAEALRSYTPENGR